MGTLVLIVSGRSYFNSYPIPSFRLWLLTMDILHQKEGENMDHPMIKEIMTYGYPKNMMDQPEHIGIDAMGDEILVGDSIIEIDGEVILEENLEDYLIEHLGAVFKTAE